MSSNHTLIDDLSSTRPESLEVDSPSTPGPDTHVHSPLPAVAAAEVVAKPRDTGGATAHRAGGLQFWLIIISLMVSSFLSALELTSVSTALPTIVRDLHGTEFAWVGSAFALAGTSFLPMSGGLAQIFGRRPVLLGSLALFAIGSGVSGGATNMSMLIGGRIRYPWTSYRILVPLILGLVLMVVFFVYEAKWAKEPVVPWQLISNRTSLSGYITVFFHGLVTIAVVYYLPVYFQGSKLQGPVHSGVSTLGTALSIAPFAIVNGVSVAIANKYRPQAFIGWAFAAIGVGLLSLLKVSSSPAMIIGFQVIEGIGLGILYSAATFPVLAAVSISENAHAIALLVFLRNFSQTWGITIGGTILQNELKRHLPEAFLDSLAQQSGTGNSQSVEIAYAVIPQVSSLPEPIKTGVRDAFATSLRIIWIVMASLCVVGFLSVLLMKELKMHEKTDEQWGYRDEPRGHASGKLAAQVDNAIEKV
ncbi:hypothetical protein FRB99_000968 [Tulasnella sp. 403]|nr:hypothetical protein FRB99_000968 [Tulasnella sp. 403]